MTKLLATGDSHIGARPDLGLKPGERLAEQETVWEWTLQQAREHGVDAILYAGDAFEQRRPDPETMLAFERPLVQHRDAGGPRVYAIVGNHDVSSQDTGTALDVFAQAGLLQLERTPRVALIEGPCLLACLPWAPTSRLAASMNNGNRDRLNEDASRLLIDVADQLYLNALEQRGTGPGRGGAPIVLLTHFSISGTSLPSGLEVGQLREPVLSQGDLRAIGYDVIVAGHIHRPQLFDQLEKISGFYVGSPMPLNFGEADAVPRGPSIVSFEADGYVTIENLPAPSRRFVNIDYGDSLAPEDIDGAYVKLRYRCTEEQARNLDLDAAKGTLASAGAHRVFVDLQIEREARARDASVDDTLSEDDALERWLASQNGAVSPELAARAQDRARDYFERVRS